MDVIECLRERFYYDETSPSCLRWSVNRQGGQGKENNKIVAGGIAGTFINKHGYRELRTLGKLWRIHRIIWMIANGNIPDKFQIDHIDGNKLNNNIANLRCVEAAINSRNQKIRPANKSGVCGVSYCVKQHSGRSYWLAHWKDIDKKLQRKHFSIDRLGNALAFKMACDLRERMISELNAAGAGYTHDHGKRGTRKTKEDECVV